MFAPKTAKSKTTTPSDRTRPFFPRASSSAARTEQTIPVHAVIPLSSQRATASVRDEASHGASPRAPRRDKKTLYIAQMSGPAAVATTRGIADSSISATIPYVTTTRNDPAVMDATDFGATKGVLDSFKRIEISEKSGVVTVNAELKHTVSTATREVEGPSHQVDITGANDAALTSANYTVAVSDLTPNLSDLKGRPPRTKFWCKDLTVTHEAYHIKDLNDSARSGAQNAQDWLSRQTVADAGDASSLVSTAWETKISAPYVAFTAVPGVEERAYDAGVAAYQTRAAAIRTRGNKGARGGYPAPPAPAPAQPAPAQPKSP